MVHGNSNVFKITKKSYEREQDEKHKVKKSDFRCSVSGRLYTPAVCTFRKCRRIRTGKSRVEDVGGTRPCCTLVTEIQHLLGQNVLPLTPSAPILFHRISAAMSHGAKYLEGLGMSEARSFADTR